MVPVAHPVLGLMLDMDCGASVEEKMEELHAILRESMTSSGLLIISGLHELEATQMVSLMEALGEREEMADWTSMPIDPEDDGKESDAVPTVEAPGEARVRILGTAVNEETGKPLSLRADIGYEWYAHAHTHTQREREREKKKKKEKRHIRHTVTSICFLISVTDGEERARVNICTRVSGIKTRLQTHTPCFTACNRLPKERRLCSPSAPNSIRDSSLMSRNLLARQWQTDPTNARPVGLRPSTHISVFG